jgi:glucose/arabinose dehydrogenase
VPAHLLPKSTRVNRHDALERPVDLKLGPDGALYVLDMGRMEIKNGKEHVFAGTGQIFRLAPSQAPAATQSAGESEAEEVSGQ